MIPFILFSTGACAVSLGAWMAYHPAGAISLGGFLIFMAIRAAAAVAAKPE